MLVLADVLTKPVEKSLSTAGSKKQYISIYPDGSGNVYVSTDSVPIEWQNAETRGKVSPVAQIYVGTSESGKPILRVKSTDSKHPIAGSIPKIVGSYWSLDYLLAGKFISEEMTVAAVNTSVEIVNAMTTVAENLLNAGMTMEQIKTILSLSSDVTSEIESRLNLLPATDANSAIDVEKTVVDDNTATDVDGESVDANL